MSAMTVPYTEQRNVALKDINVAEGFNPRDRLRPYRAPLLRREALRTSSYPLWTMRRWAGCARLEDRRLPFAGQILEAVGIQERLVKLASL